MGKQVQILRGTAIENDKIAGEEGVLTYDTDNKNVRIHDGVKLGGRTVCMIPDYASSKRQNVTDGFVVPSDGWIIGWINFSGSNVDLGLQIDKVTVVNSPWCSGAWGKVQVSLPVKQGSTINYYNPNGATIESTASLNFYPNCSE